MKKVLLILTTLGILTSFTTATASLKNAQKPFAGKLPQGNLPDYLTMIIASCLKKDDLTEKGFRCSGGMGFCRHKGGSHYFCVGQKYWHFPGTPA